MTHRKFCVGILMVLAACSTAPTALAQELTDRPVKFEVGGTPGGGTWLGGGDDDTEVNFNLYTFSGFADWYLTQKVAVEGEYTVGLGWGQDILFRNGRIPGQQVPYTNTLMGSVLVYPRGAGGRLPFYLAGGGGLMNLRSRKPTRKLGYDPDTNPSESFTASSIGAGIKIPRGASAPNWSFRFDYRMLFVNSNSDAPAFFAKNKSRKGHHIQFGMLYSFRR